MEKKRQHEEEAPTEGKKMCKEGMRAKSALVDFSSKDNEVLEDFGGSAAAPAAKPAFSFGSQPATPSHSAFKFGRQPAAAQPAFNLGSQPAASHSAFMFGSQPAFNSESYGTGFKAGFKTGFESGFEAGFKAGNNQAKPSFFSPCIFGQAKPLAFSFGRPSTDSGAPTSQGTSSSLASLKRYKQVSLIFLLPLITISLQFFKEEKTSSLFTPEGSRLLGQAEDVNIEANAALQAQLAKINKNLNF